MKKLLLCLALLQPFVSAFSTQSTSALTEISLVNEINQKKTMRCYTNSSVEMFKKPDTASKSVKMLSFGEPLDLLTIEGNWCKVKTSDGRRGYIPAAALLMDKDYKLLQSCVEYIPKNRKRVLFLYSQLPMAILDFLKSNHIEGKSQWKFFIPRFSNRFSNSYSYCVGKSEHHKDVAFILTNVDTSEQVLAIYTFGEQGNPILALQSKAPQGVVLSMFDYNKDTNRYAVKFGPLASSNEELSKQTAIQDFDDAVMADANTLAKKDCRPAYFPGGAKALLKYISSHLVYPDISVKQKLEGTVNVRFRIEKDGSIGMVQIVNGISSEMDAEVVRVVKTLPRFLPAFDKGKPVPSWMSVPVAFRIM